MSLEVIKSQMKAFLRSKESEVLAIRGDWGVGKTFTWDQTLREAQTLKFSGNDSNSIGLSYYSYVSLFGISNLQDLRTEIAFNKLNTLDLQHAEGVTKIQKSSGKYAPKLLSQALKYTGVNAGTLIDTMFASISNSMIKNTIVCIDDFERTSISEKDALGFINDLKCKRNCKVVLLLNDKKTKEFKSYREKVIDYDIKFDLTPEEAAGLIFADKKSDDLYSIIIDNCVRLGTTNLRVIKKIMNLVDCAAEDFGLLKYHLDLQLQFINTAVLAAHCFYENKPDTPPISYIRNTALRTHVGIHAVTNSQPNYDESKEEKEERDRYESYEKFLGQYGFEAFDKFDGVIFDAVESGYINRPNFNHWAQERNMELNYLSARNEITDQLFYLTNSFLPPDQVEKEILLLSEACDEYACNMDKRTLNETYNIFDFLGFEEEREKVLRSYKIEFKDNPEKFNTNTHRDLRSIAWHPKLKKELDDHVITIQRQPSIEEILKSLGSGIRKLNKNESDILNKMKREKVLEILNKSSLQDFGENLEILVKLGKIDPELKPMRQTVISALKDYAKESKQASFLLKVQLGENWDESS